MTLGTSEPQSPRHLAASALEKPPTMLYSSCENRPHGGTVSPFYAAEAPTSSVATFNHPAPAEPPADYRQHRKHEKK